LNKPWFLHETLIKGGELVLDMGANPNKKWGAGLKNAPPSMTKVQD
jgi:putative alpha-1,2-mannosidase